MDRSAVQSADGLAVGDKMFGGGHQSVFHVFPLHSADIRRAHPGYQQRILPERFLGPSPTRIDGDIQDRSQSLARADRQHLPADFSGHPFHQAGIPRAGQPDHLRVERAAHAHVPGTAFLMEDGRNTQARAFLQKPLQDVPGAGNLNGSEQAGSPDAGDLADAVLQEYLHPVLRKHLPGARIVEPVRGQLRKFFLDRHPFQQVPQPDGDGMGRILVKGFRLSSLH